MFQIWVLDFRERKGERQRGLWREGRGLGGLNLGDASIGLGDVNDWSAWSVDKKIMGVSDTCGDPNGRTCVVRIYESHGTSAKSPKSGKADPRLVYGGLVIFGEGSSRLWPVTVTIAQARLARLPIGYGQLPAKGTKKNKKEKKYEKIKIKSKIIENCPLQHRRSHVDRSAFTSAISDQN